jgi:hypothetical protein
MNIVVAFQAKSLVSSMVKDRLGDQRGGVNGSR